MFYDSNVCNIHTPLFFIQYPTFKEIQMVGFSRQVGLMCTCSCFDAVDLKKSRFAD